MKTAKNLNWVIAVAGVWEVVAPFVLSYTKHTTPMWDAIIVGIVLVVLGAWAALSNAVGTVKILSWVNAVIGLWLIVAPFVLSYTKVTAAMWNDIIVGIIVVVLGAWAALTAKE